MIIGRSGWGALPPNRVAPQLKVGLTVVVHHSATGFATDILHAEAETLAIQRDHLARLDANGNLQFADIAYNLLVGPDVVLVGRGIEVQGGATGNGYDDRTVSVCVLGNLQDNELPAAERRALIEAVRMCWERFGVTSMEPHRNFYTTSCPGDHLVAQLTAIETDAKGDDDVTDADIDKLSTAIVDKYFERAITLNDGEPPQSYPSTVQGWYVFMHQMTQQLTRKP